MLTKLPRKRLAAGQGLQKQDFLALKTVFSPAELCCSQIPKLALEGKLRKRADVIRVPWEVTGAWTRGH